MAKIPPAAAVPAGTHKLQAPSTAITETAGYGGFAMAAAPGIVSWVGGSVAYAIENTQKMYEITCTKHKYFRARMRSCSRS